jgi:hypothetical protein
VLSITVFRDHWAASEAAVGGARRDELASPTRRGSHFVLLSGAGLAVAVSLIAGLTGLLDQLLNDALDGKAWADQSPAIGVAITSAGLGLWRLRQMAADRVELCGLIPPPAMDDTARPATPA